MSIGARIFKLRKHLNLTQERFALLLGVDHAHISKIEKGKGSPSELLLNHICCRFFISKSWIDTGQGNMMAPPEDSLIRQLSFYGQQSLMNAFLNVLSEYVHEGILFSLEETIKNQIARYGEQAVIEVLNNIIKEHYCNEIAVGHQPHQATTGDHELDDIISFFKELWESGDQRIKNWAAVQLERAFPEILERRNKKEKVNSGENNDFSGVAENENVYIPLLGYVAAGKPIDAIETIDGYVPVPINQAKGKTFLAQLKGDSMTGDGLFDGDFVIIRADMDVEIGEIGLFKINNEVTLKRKKVIDNDIYLISSNPEYKPIPVSDLRHFRTIGKYLGRIPKIMAENQLIEVLHDIS